MRAAYIIICPDRRDDVTKAVILLLLNSLTILFTCAAVGAAPPVQTWTNGLKLALSASVSFHI